MTQHDCASLMIWCGALNDIAEKNKDYYSGRQLKEAQKKIEKIAVKYLPINDQRKMK